VVAGYRACIKTNRILCVDLYAAYVLELVHASNEKIPSIKTHPNLMVYFPHRLTSLLIDKDEKLVYGLRRGASKLVKGDLSVNPSKYVVLFRPNLLGDLGRYINNTKVCLTTSIWAQYWEQDKPEMKRLKEWLATKPELRKRLSDIHTSGHADVESLQEIVEHIQPKAIIPIHTEHSDSFSSLFPNNSVLEVADEVHYSMTD
jgi:ribonuclease J